MRKFETVVALTIKTLVYVCAIAGGVVFGIGMADCITFSEFSNVALVLPMRIAVGVFTGCCATIMCLIFLDGMLDP